MGEDHHRRPVGRENITTAPMEPTSNENGNSSFQDLIRYDFHGSNIGAHAIEQQGHLAMSQNEPYLSNNAVKDAVDENSYVENGVGGMMSRKYTDRTQAVVGQALKDRRRLARDRIRRGGWADHIATMAICYSEQIAWKDLPSNMTCVQKFLKGIEKLGEFCNDVETIRRFLDANIHRLITFHAMAKDFKVPDCIIRRANQTTRNGNFKYLWFRLFIKEYQNLDKTPAAFWVGPYRAQGEQATTGGFATGPGRILQGDTRGGTTATSPATTALSSSLGQNINIPTMETSQISVDLSDHMRKRKRAPDDTEELDMDILATEVKRESTEDSFVGIIGNRHDDDAASADTEEAEDGEDKQEARSRTLTVLFHGMRGDDAKESEHVQVYVPRTAKGVTINFL